MSYTLYVIWCEVPEHVYYLGMDLMSGFNLRLKIIIELLFLTSSYNLFYSLTEDGKKELKYSVVLESIV